MTGLGLYHVPTCRWVQPFLDSAFGERHAAPVPVDCAQHRCGQSPSAPAPPVQAECRSVLKPCSSQTPSTLEAGHG